MPITKSKSFTTTDGAIHPTIEAAREHELLALVTKNLPLVQVEEEDQKSVCQFLIEHADTIVNMLTLKATSRPAARRPRKPKATPAGPPENQGQNHGASKPVAK